VNRKRQGGAAQDFAVVPPSKWAVITIVGLLLVLPVVGFLTAAMASGTYPTHRAGYFALALLLVVAFTLLLMMRRLSVSIGDGQLVVRATLYTLRLRLSELDLDAARIVDLREHREHLPRWKTNGFSVPGLLAGHFRGQGMSKQFVLLTDRSRVLLLPQRGGRLIVLSLEHPHEALKALRHAADRRD